MEKLNTLLNEINEIDEGRRDYLLDFFKDIPPEIERYISKTKVIKGRYILKSGDPNSTVYFLLKGKVSAESFTQNGQIYSFMDFSKMHTLGDFELFCKSDTYCASILADEDCYLLKLPTKYYWLWIKDDPYALCLRLSNILSVMTFERILDRSYLQLGSMDRLVMLLISFYERDFITGRGSYKVRYTQEELAARIGVNLRSVQRNVASLAANEYISLNKGKIVISEEQYEKIKNYIKKEDD